MKEQAKERYKLELTSPAAFLGINNQKQFIPSRFYAFDQYKDERDPGQLKTLQKHFRLLLVNIYGRDQSLVKMAAEFKSDSGKLAAHNDKLMRKMNAILDFVGISEDRSSLFGSYGIFSKLQFLNPLKLVELLVSSARLLLHFMLTVTGSGLDAFANKQHPVAKYILKSLVAVIGLVRFVVDTGMQLAKLTVRAIASPFTSFHELNAISPVLGVLSATISTGGLLAALITAPIWLPFVGAGAGAASVCATLPLWVKPVIGTLAMLWIMTSGLISDAYIVGRDFANPNNSVVLDGHPARRKFHHRQYHDGDSDLRLKVYKDYLGMFVGTATGILPLMMVVGLVVGLAKRGYKAISRCGQPSGLVDFSALTQSDPSDDKSAGHTVPSYESDDESAGHTVPSYESDDESAGHTGLLYEDARGLVDQEDFIDPVLAM